jgi:hypothetical protein
MRAMRERRLLLVLFTCGCAISAAQASTLATTKEQVIQPTSRVQFAAELELYRGFDEEEKSYQSTAIQPTYRLSLRKELSGVGGYTYRLAERETKADPNFEWEDAEATFRYEAFDHSNAEGRWVTKVGLGAVIPISQVSQEASLRASATTEVSSRYFQRAAPFVLGLGAKAYVHSYKYDTANAAGTVYNHRYDVRTSLDGEWRWTDRLSTSLVARLLLSENAFGSRFLTQIYEARVEYRQSDKSSFFLKGRTKDRVVSNNSMLDDDNTRLGIGATILF